MMSSMNWPYIAGLFDGEGWLGLRHTTGVRSKQRGIQAHVAIAQADKEGGVACLNAVREYLLASGIKCHLNVYRRKKATHKDGWMLRIASRKSVAAFLWGVLPYLIVRRVFAQDLLRFLTTFPALPKGPNAAIGFRRCRS